VAYHEQNREGKQAESALSASVCRDTSYRCRQLKINDGDVTVISSKRGEVQVKAKISAQIKPGVVFLPMHWGKILNNDLNRANNFTSDRLTPYQKNPILNIAP
jgi:anaerobic selenocysteine-containing dehydrogenase